MKVEKGSEERCRRCPTSEGSPVLLGINFSLLVTAAMKTRSRRPERKSQLPSWKEVHVPRWSEMIQRRREWSGDAIRQTSFGIVPGEESFMGMEWCGAVLLSPSLHAKVEIVRMLFVSRSLQSLLASL